MAKARASQLDEVQGGVNRGTVTGPRWMPTPGPCRQVSEATSSSRRSARGVERLPAGLSGRLGTLVSGISGTTGSRSHAELRGADDR